MFRERDDFVRQAAKLHRSSSKDAFRGMNGSGMTASGRREADVRPTIKEVASTTCSGGAAWLAEPLRATEARLEWRTALTLVLSTY